MHFDTRGKLVRAQRHRESTHTMKNFSITFAVVAAMSLTIAGCGKKQADNKAKPAAAAAKKAAPKAAPAASTAHAGIPARMPVTGGKDALVTIIEVSDFQCPFCSRVGPTMKKIKATYKDQVRIVWINNALSFHNRAKPAALAALAAHRQGKFWEMHDKLFANQRALTDENFKKWAGELKLDAAKFDKDMKDAVLGKQVDREQLAANALGARGTPGFFINGKLLSGAQPFPAFKKEIDAALEGAKKLRDAGKKGKELMTAAFAANNAANGAKMYGYFFGDAKIAAPKPQARKKPEGPVKPPRDSYTVWKVPVDAKNDVILGDSAKAQVTIVEFSDFECPYCSRGKNTVDQVKKAYGDKVRVVFKHHPLPFHRNARAAHRASVAAGKQGKFWPFQDKCFANARALNEDNYKAWAKELGLDMAKFDKDRKDKSSDDQIKKDMELASKVSIRGTPNFVINGRKLVGAQPLAMFKAIVDEELKKAGDKKGQSYYDSVISKGKVFSILDSKVNAFDVDGLPYKGDKNAKVTIVEFSDFQCPYCSRVAVPVNEVAKRFKGKVKVVFAHYPLNFHKQARPASWLAQHAFEKGGPDSFWKVHDKLFEKQRELSAETIAAVAKEFGYDMKKVEAQKAKYDGVIKKAMAMGNQAGLRGTPTLYINGRKYEGQPSPSMLAQTVDKLLTGKL
ncbi:MAG TPA: thioredoxin [Myxococcales bacterium]|nr:thioredoxin [Myxococcales bacterium]